MLYRRLADVVVIIHWLLGGFFLLGGFWAEDHDWIAVFHIPLAMWVCAAFIMGWTCPLTPLENRLRKAAGERGYEGGFIDHYLGGFAGNTPPDGQPPSKSSRKNKVLGVVFCIVALGPHFARLDRYFDAIRSATKTPAAKPSVAPERG
jgi:hypothetical protein